jgi:hypothetical protein
MTRSNVVCDRLCPLWFSALPHKYFGPPDGGPCFY